MPVISDQQIVRAFRKRRVKTITAIKGYPVV
jgi:hypothetical protein